MSNHYETLGVSKNASADEIKQSYRKLAKENHPDKGGDKEKFQNIQEAYDTLSDSQKKQEYDNPAPDLSSLFGDMGMGGGGGFPFNLNSFFGGRASGQSSNKKSNHSHNCNIKLQDVYNGIKKTFNLSRSYICKNCNKNCSNCNGTGQTVQRIQMGPMVQIINSNCNHCSSTGKTRTNSSCNKCNSTGNIQEKKLVELTIPKGIENRKQFVYEGWGEQSTKENEVAGDLIIIINIEQHDLFERDGLNLKCTLSLTFKESIIGKKIIIPYFSEPFEYDIQLQCGIVNPNKEYVVLNKGLYDERGTKGKMYIKFKIKYPDYKMLNNKEVKLINDLLDTLSVK